MRVTFGQPLAALAGLAGLVPVLVSLTRLRAGRRVRAALGLADPAWPARLARPLLLAGAFGLLALAAARPVLHRTHDVARRADVEMVVVLDSSRSMLASSLRGSPERWQRARIFAARLRADLPGVPMGLSSLTNRLLPYLFPTSSVRAFDLVLDQSYGIERPPPALTIEPWVTIFDPLGQVTVARFFTPGVARRVLVVLTDAEAHPFDAAGLRRRLERAGTMPIVVRFWRPGERIFRPGAASYRSTQPGALTALRRAGWAAFPETRLAAARAAVVRAAGSGPTTRVGAAEYDTALAPASALAALLVLLSLATPRTPGGLLRRGRTRVPAVVLARFRHNGRRTPTSFFGNHG